MASILISTFRYPARIVWIKLSARASQQVSYLTDGAFTITASVLMIVAQAARMNVPNTWKGLIDEATKREAIALINALSSKVENEDGLKVISK